MIEVEQKFRVQDLAAFERKLVELQATESGSRVQIDHYFNHPSRDFAITDEAFRIRTDGDKNRMTYKGPKLDKTTKSRKEIEFPIGDGAEVRDQAAEALLLLGFRSVREVKKLRRFFELNLRGNPFATHLAERGILVSPLDHMEASIDIVDELGTFVELEVVCKEDSLSETRQVLLAAAEALGLRDVERRSYLQMLLEADTQ